MIPARPLRLAPMGEVDPDLLRWLGEELEPIFGHPVTIGEEQPLPDEAYDPRRRQYRSDDLLRQLQRRVRPQTWRLLGVVAADLYAPGLNFVFGQASLAEETALIALARLRPTFYHQPPDETLFRQRVLKEAVHEIGHTLGLRHCPDPHCVMRFSNSLVETDIKHASFCPRCARQIA